MTATTHTEIYRRFTGKLTPARPAFVPLYRARLRTALKRKLPLLVLLVLPWITAVIFSFVVYARFALEEQTDDTGGLPLAAALAASWARQMLEVHQQILNFIGVSRWFALLTIAWYGSGLICEDRRAGVHLLYFSRPLTRLDYFCAHLATACTFGAFVVALPALLICLVAVFSSPEYAFLTEKWNVLLGSLTYSVVNVLVTALVVLAVSSLASRKTYALAGIFVVFMGSFFMGNALHGMSGDEHFVLLSLIDNFGSIADGLMNASQTRWEWSPWLSGAVLAGVALVSLALIAWRLRRMEVVG